MLAKYTELLLKLHKLYLNGENDSSEADSIRDEMDEPWELLNNEERSLMHKLSVALQEK